jgi:hypothetical protein
VARLIADPDARARLGSNGAALVERRFRLDQGIAVLAAKFGLSQLAAEAGADQSMALQQSA